MAYADSESDIFGGWRLTPEQQYREEITSLLAQIYNTIDSYGVRDGLCKLQRRT